MLDLRGKSLALTVSIVCAFGWALQGYDQAVMNGILDMETFIKQFPTIDTVHSTGSRLSRHSLIQGTTVAVYEAGCTFGAITCYFVGDILGRRRVMLIVTGIALVGVIIQSSSFQLGQLIAGRVISGLGVGGITATVPMWVSECSPPEKRGGLVAISGFFAITGVVLVSWIEFGLNFVQGNSVNWRFPIAFQAVFALIALVLSYFLPESPAWLIKVNRESDALDVLCRLFDVTDREDPRVVQEKTYIITELMDDIGTSNSISPFSINEFRHLHRTVLAVVLNMLAQMSGINVVAFYSSTIFQQQLGYSGNVSRLISACLNIWECVASFVPVVMVDRVGRRKLLLFGAVVMFTAQACLAGLSSDLRNESSAKACIFFYFVAVFGYPVGLFLVPFVYAAEVTPLAVRAKVTAMAGAINWVFNFMIAEVSPTAFNDIGWRYYLVYACVNFFTIFFVYFLIPETKGLAFTQVDQIFVECNSIFDVVSIARRYKPIEDSFADEKPEAAEHIEEVV